MPDRDPALEKALNDFRKRGNIWVDGMAMFAAGWHAAFRSLGCATPEAQAALRELVGATTPAMRETLGRIITAAEWADQHKTQEFWMPEEGTQKLRLYALRMEDFAALATPPEEGR